MNNQVQQFYGSRLTMFYDAGRGVQVHQKFLSGRRNLCEGGSNPGSKYLSTRHQWGTLPHGDQVVLQVQVRLCEQHDKSLLFVYR